MKRAKWYMCVVGFGPPAQNLSASTTKYVAQSVFPKTNRNGNPRYLMNDTEEYRHHMCCIVHIKRNTDDFYKLIADSIFIRVRFLLLSLCSITMDRQAAMSIQTRQKKGVFISLAKGEWDVIDANRRYIYTRQETIYRCNEKSRYTPYDGTFTPLINSSTSTGRCQCLH